MSQLRLFDLPLPAVQVLDICKAAVKEMGLQLSSSQGLVVDCKSPSAGFMSLPTVIKITVKEIDETGSYINLNGSNKSKGLMGQKAIAEVLLDLQKRIESITNRDHPGLVIPLATVQSAAITVEQARKQAREQEAQAHR